MNIVKIKSNLIPYKKASGEILFYLSLGSKSAKQYPDCFGFWGGGIEGGESSKQAMFREIKEELDYSPREYKYLGRYYDSMPNEKHIYYCEVSDDFENQVKILESQGGKFFRIEEIINEVKIINDDKKILSDLNNLLHTCPKGIKNHQNVDGLF